MADLSSPGWPRAPWHLWVVGVLAALWNGASCYSYVMTLTRSAAYFDATGLTAEMIAYFAALPAWYVAAWTVAVWGALLASLGLLVRRSWAVSLFAISLPGAIVMTAATLLNANTREMFGPVGLAMSAMVVVIGGFELLYSKAMKKTGVLR